MSTTSNALASAPDVAEAVIGASVTDDCIVIVEERFDADVRFANNTTTTNGVRRDRRVTIVAILDQPSGRSVGIAVVAVPSISAHFSSTRRSRHVMPKRPRTRCRSCRARSTRTSPIHQNGPTCRSSDRCSMSSPKGSAAPDRKAGRSLGLRATSGRRSISRPRAGCGVVTSSRPGRSSSSRANDGIGSAWAGRGSATFGDISVSALERDLVERLEWAKRRVELPAGRYEVILPPDAVADLVIEIAGACSGRDAEDGGTVFSSPGGGTRRGERLFDLPFTLRSDPGAAGIECTPFVIAGGSTSDESVFDNGQPITPVSWIEDGELRRLRYHRAGALRSQAPFAPPIDNLVLEQSGATGDLASLIAHTERGLLLTCLWYIREVDPETLLLTGLTRDGIYLVEHGEITGAVNNFRFNESPLNMLANVIEVGRTERALSREWGEWMNRTAMPPLRVDGFNMSSVSPAN